MVRSPRPGYSQWEKDGILHHLRDISLRYRRETLTVVLHAPLWSTVTKHVRGLPRVVCEHPSKFGLVHGFDKEARINSEQARRQPDTTVLKWPRKSVGFVVALLWSEGDIPFDLASSIETAYTDSKTLRGEFSLGSCRPGMFRKGIEHMEQREVHPIQKCLVATLR